MSSAQRAASVAVVVGIVVVGCGSGSVHGRSASDSSGVVALSSSAPVLSPPASASVVDPSAGTATALAGDHWSQLPAAPIAPRTGGVVAWTGTHLPRWRAHNRRR